jgi:uncharacterized membrane protein (DUF373 family)
VGELAARTWWEATELRTRRLWDGLLSPLQLVEDGIHLLVAVLLTVIAVVLFIVAELLHTVRITIRDRTLDAGPFLVIGLIAGIRRVLIVTAQAERSFQWNPQGIELLILIALILAMAVTILVWRHSTTSGEDAGAP